MRKNDCKKTAYRGLSRFTVWGGLVCISLLAVPTGVLIFLISGIWSAADKVSGELEKKGE